jgi:CRISPR/Cas system-associated exonuclease Cas4 (RecB family)
MSTYSEHVLRQAPWSISKVGVLDLCMKQFLHKYIEKLKEGKKSGASRVGVVAHAILEDGLRTPNADLQSVLRTQAEEQQLSREELIEVSAKMSPIADFIKRIETFKTNNGVVEEFIEHKLALNERHESCSFFETKDEAGNITSKPLLRGVIDHAMRTSDDFLIVLDHKSGRKKDIGEHSTQFYAYMALATAAFPWLKGVQAGINYIGEPKVDWFPRFDNRPGAWTREEIVRIVFPWLQQYLNRTAVKLSQIEAGNVRPETGWQCLYCGFSSVCEKGQEELDRRARRKSAPNL